MTVVSFKTLWGAVGDGTPHKNFKEAIAANTNEGWDGVVYAPILQQSNPELGTLAELTAHCRESGLDLVVVVHTSGNDLQAHLDQLAPKLREAATANPCHVIAQTGLDRFSDDDVDRLIRRTEEIADDIGLVVAHETHRNRPLFTPWSTARVLERHPGIRLVIDYSHWVVVAERLLPDEDEIIRAAARHAVQIDARVGHEECAQVPDPSAPEWAEHVAAFDRWWKITRDEAFGAGLERLVVVPEYGPPPFQQALPRTGQTTTDLWATCEEQRRRVETLLG